MRIALFSDVHGNSYALDAVLADIAEMGGVDAYWVLGDLAKMGSDPAGVLERLDSLENAVFVRGNTDDHLVTGTMPTQALEMSKRTRHSCLSLRSLPARQAGRKVS